MRQVGLFPIPSSQGGSLVPVLSLPRFPHETCSYISNSQVPGCFISSSSIPCSHMRQVGLFPLPRSQGGSLVPVLSFSRSPHKTGWFISNSQVSSLDRLVNFQLPGPRMVHLFQFYAFPGSHMRQAGLFVQFHPYPGFPYKTGCFICSSFILLQVPL